MVKKQRETHYRKELSPFWLTIILNGEIKRFYSSKIYRWRGFRHRKVTKHVGLCQSFWYYLDVIRVVGADHQYLCGWMQSYYLITPLQIILFLQFHSCVKRTAYRKSIAVSNWTFSFSMSCLDYNKENHFSCRLFVFSGASDWEGFR